MSTMKTFLLTILILGWSLKSEAVELAQFEVSSSSTQLSNGESITCIPILEQPSLSSVHWKDINYQEALLETLTEINTKSDGAHPEIKQAEQVFTSEVGPCPEGTIPILQHRGSVTRKVSAVPGRNKRFYKSFHPKNTTFNMQTTASQPDLQPALDLSQHEYGTAYNGGIQSTFGGAGASFNIWKPMVEDPGEFSLAQLWIYSGSYEQGNLNTIEVGWQVSSQYEDDLPHLFVYWTRDAYKSTGCYNLNCPGFVQVSNKYVVGGAFADISQKNGNQAEVNLLVKKDTSKPNGDWVLYYNYEKVGYWPTSIFTLLKTGAETVDFGGEIINLQSKTGRHTMTDMGSGEFAAAGYQKAAYIRRLKTVNLQGTSSDAPLAPNDGPTATDSGCYSAVKGANTDWGTYLYFGGTGYSNTCTKHR